jgi:hypothetical protein
MSSLYSQISASTQIKPMAAKLKGIFVSAASSTPTITVYDSPDSDNTDPKIIATFTPTAGVNYNFFDGLYANNGLYVAISGTVSCTIAYE